MFILLNELHVAMTVHLSHLAHLGLHPVGIGQRLLNGLADHRVEFEQGVVHIAE